MVARHGARAERAFPPTPIRTPRPLPGTAPGLHDPVQAFVDLRAAGRTGGALRAVVWRGPEQDPFTTRAEESAADMIIVGRAVPDVPGQFGLADRDRTRDILVAAPLDELDTHLWWPGRTR